MCFSQCRKLAPVLILGILTCWLSLPWQISAQAADQPGAFGPKSASPETAQVRDDRIALVKGNSEFAFDLYGRIRRKPGNLFFSPYSVSTALAMTSAGARGKTLDEITRVQHLPVAQDRLHLAFASLLWDLSGGGNQKGCQLRIANALWGKKSYGFDNEFLSTLQTTYGAGLYTVDFAGATEEARQTVNAWVDKQTDSKIKALLKPGAVDAMTRLVLINAVYFKGDWDKKFNKQNTKEEPFFGTGESMKASLMFQSGKFKYFKGSGFRALELPYASTALAMVVLLPDKADGLAEFEKLLTATNLNTWLGQLRPMEALPVWLPKFKATGEFQLKSELEALGMVTAFRTGAADFSGMNAGKEPFSISDMIHKAYVDVNEEGTEAAAATAGTTKAFVVQPDPPQFRADHPFVFLIRDTRSGSIIFLGRLVNPKS